MTPADDAPEALAATAEGGHPVEGVQVAAGGDVGVLVELAGAAIGEKRGQKGGEVWARRERRGDPLEDSFARALEDQQQRVLLGTLDGVAVGFGAAHIETLADGGLLGVVDEVYVDPGARELGVGELLMETLVDWCRDRGCFGVDSLALPGDRATKNFFESFGLVARAIVVHRRLS
jgi:GNAT superfamily N-acetyltransferase